MLNFTGCSKKLDWQLSEVKQNKLGDFSFVGGKVSTLLTVKTFKKKKNDI